MKFIEIGYLESASTRHFVNTSQIVSVLISQNSNAGFSVSVLLTGGIQISKDYSTLQDAENAYVELQDVLFSGSGDNIEKVLL